MARTKSTAAKADAAFKRVVEAQRKFGFPRWETAAEVKSGAATTEFMQLESKDRDQIREDMDLVLSVWPRFPWHNADRVPVKEPKPRKPKEEAK